MKYIVCSIGPATLVYLAFAFIFLDLNPAAWGEASTRTLCVIYMAMAAGYGAFVASIFIKESP